MWSYPAGSEVGTPRSQCPLVPGATLNATSPLCQACWHPAGSLRGSTPSPNATPSSSSTPGPERPQLRVSLERSWLCLAQVTGRSTFHINQVGVGEHVPWDWNMQILMMNSRSSENQ